MLEQIKLVCFPLLCPYAATGRKPVKTSGSVRKNSPAVTWTICGLS